MKVFYSSLIFIGFVFFISCNKGPTQEELNKYLEAIADQENQVLQKLNNLIDVYDSFNSTAELQEAYKAVYAQLDTSEIAVKNIKGFENDDILKASALEFFNEIKSLLDNEHKRIIELYSMPDDQFKDKEQAELESLRDSTGKKADAIMAKAEKAYSTFESSYLKN
jgi:esterase/lipase